MKVPTRVADNSQKSVYPLEHGSFVSLGVLFKSVSFIRT